MTVHVRRHPARRLALFAATVALAAAACGGSSSPSPVATATPTAVPPTATPEPSIAVTPEPSVAATPAGSASAADPTEDLAIAAPFALEPLQGGMGELMRDTIQQQLGSLAGAIPIGARQVSRDGAPAGFVLAMDVSGIPGSDTDAFATSLLQGLQGAAGEGQVRQEEIGGITVSVIEQAGQGIAVHQQDGLVLMSFGLPSSATVEIAEALIGAQ